MTTEEKELLLKDLSARLPYGVKCDRLGRARKLIRVDFNDPYPIMLDSGYYIPQPYTVEDIKPYLRPMSSMTEEEKKELLNIVCGKGSKYFHISEEGIDNNDAEVQRGPNFEFHWVNFSYKNIEKATDWLNKKMFDWRGLIPKGLALESPKSMYNN